MKKRLIKAYIDSPELNEMVKYINQHINDSVPRQLCQDALTKAYNETKELICTRIDNNDATDKNAQMLIVRNLICGFLEQNAKELNITTTDIAKSIVQGTKFEATLNKAIEENSDELTELLLDRPSRMYDRSMCGQFPFGGFVFRTGLTKDFESTLFNELKNFKDKQKEYD